MFTAARTFWRTRPGAKFAFALPSRIRARGLLNQFYIKTKKHTLITTEVNKITTPVKCARTLVFQGPVCVRTLDAHVHLNTGARGPPVSPVLRPASTKPFGVRQKGGLLESPWFLDPESLPSCFGTHK